MSTLPLGKRTFPLPDFQAIRLHREAMRRSIDWSSEGVLRAQQLVILDGLDRTDTKMLGFLDEVRTSFHALDIRSYTNAIRQLDRDSRTQEQNLAFVRYQHEAAAEMLGLVESVRGSLGRLDGMLCVLKTAPLDAAQQMTHVRSVLENPPVSESQQHSAVFLLEDVQAAVDMAAARRDYLDEVEKTLIPIRFFCEMVIDSGEDVIQVASRFHRRVDELGDYLSKVREGWQG